MKSINIDSHVKFMARAFQEADKGSYTTKPNPSVGCVIVKNNKIVASGYHHSSGKPHAEVNAIHSYCDKYELDMEDCLNGCDIYITLEPCSHTGKTPPCSELILKSRPDNVFYGSEDPNPLVASRGINMLKKSNIPCHFVPMDECYKELNAFFFYRMKHKKPFVFAKIATSIDGATGMKSNESKWITSSESRSDVMELRARSCAILTGVGTVIADDPTLNARIGEPCKQPDLIILDRNLRTPPQAKSLSLRSRRSYIVTLDTTKNRMSALKFKEADLVDIIFISVECDFISEFNMWLSGSSFNSIMVESGSQLFSSLLDMKILDEIVLYIAPKLLGTNTQSLFPKSIERLCDHIPLEFTSIQQIKEDLKLTLKVCN